MSIQQSRQVRKTRAAILTAFRDTVLAKECYDGVRVGDIIRRADIGRSTFYLHFEDKDDLLRQSVSGVLDPIADAVLDHCDQRRIACSLDHFQENGRFARRLLAGSSCEHIVSVLAGLIERRLEQICAQDGAMPVLPPFLVAGQISAALIGVIRAWLGRPDACSSAELAAAMVASSVAQARSLLAAKNA